MRPLISVVFGTFFATGGAGSGEEDERQTQRRRAPRIRRPTFRRHLQRFMARSSQADKLS